MNRILFVDDESNTLQAYQRALRRRFQFETALGAREALEAVRRHGPFAVVIADVRMPEMSGIELLVEIRKLSPDTVRMILTGNADRQTVNDAIQLGHVFCFLTKPCSPEAIAEALDAGLAHYASIVEPSAPES